jgi:hypothetical protein
MQVAEAVLEAVFLVLVELAAVETARANHHLRQQPQVPQISAVVAAAETLLTVRAVLA